MLRRGKNNEQKNSKIQVLLLITRSMIIWRRKDTWYFLTNVSLNPVTSSDQLILIVTRTYELKIEPESNLFKQSVWQFAHAMEF